MKKLLISSVLLLGGLSISQAQNINTIAGNGAPGYTGDGGAATAAELSNPDGMCINLATGNIYSAMPTSNCIREVSTSGIITTVAGNGTAGYTGDGGKAILAEIDDPIDVCIDSVGNLYIADRSNNVIRKVNTSGIITTVAGTGIPGYSGDGGNATSAELDQPGGVSVVNGNIYIADYMNSVIRKVNSSGIISTIAGTGLPGYSGDGGPATSAELNYAIGVTATANGNVYIADNSNNVIRMVNASGIISTIAGTGVAGYSGDGGPATSAELNWPTRLSFDSVGNMLIADHTNGSIRKINKLSGIISTIAGTGVEGFSGDGGPAISAELENPCGVVESRSGKIYIDDEGNQRIRAITPINTAGIDEVQSANGLYVFPNPANQLLSIKKDGNFSSGIITITDVTGRTILSQNMSNMQNIIQVNVSDLANGVYFVTIENQGNRYISKFVKD